MNEFDLPYYNRNSYHYRDAGEEKMIRKIIKILAYPLLWKTCLDINIEMNKFGFSDYYDTKHPLRDLKELWNEV